jgi:hypothetical protein
MSTKLFVVDPYFKVLRDYRKYSKESVELYEQVNDEVSQATDVEQLENILKKYETIPVENYEDNPLNIIKYNNYFYHIHIASETAITKYNSEINIDYAEKIEINEYMPFVIKNLNKIIKGDLNIFDRAKIRDIAYKAFVTNIELSSQSYFENGVSFINCLDIQFSEYAHYLLREGDFEFEIPKRSTRR